MLCSTIKVPLLILSLTLFGCGGVAKLEALSEPFQLTDTPLIAAQLYAEGDIALTMSRLDITLWNVGNEQAIFSHLLDQDKEGQTLAALSNDQRYLATAGKQTVTLYDVKNNQTSLAWKVYGTVEHASISVLAINDFGDKVVVGLTDGSLSVTDIKSKTRLLYQPHLSEIQFLYFNKLNNKLVTAGVDGRLVVLSLESGIIEQEYQFPARITSLHLDSRTEQLFSSDALSNEIITTLANINATTHLDYIDRYRHFRQALFLNSSQIVTSNSKFNLSVWSTQKGHEVASGTIEGHSATASISSLAKKDNTIISLTNEGIIQYWPIPSNE